MSEDSVENREAAVELILETGESLLPAKYNKEWCLWIAHMEGSGIPLRVHEWRVHSYKLEDGTEVVL